jgi:hypothetical protein
VICVRSELADLEQVQVERLDLDLHAAERPSSPVSTVCAP